MGQAGEALLCLQRLLLLCSCPRGSWKSELVREISKMLNADT